jgi:hypothetical protein
MPDSDNSVIDARRLEAYILQTSCENRYVSELREVMMSIHYSAHHREWDRPTYVRHVEAALTLFFLPVSLGPVPAIYITKIAEVLAPKYQALFDLAEKTLKAEGYSALI